MHRFLPIRKVFKYSKVYLPGVVRRLAAARRRSHVLPASALLTILRNSEIFLFTRLRTPMRTFRLGSTAPRRFAILTRKRFKSSGGAVNVFRNFLNTVRFGGLFTGLFNLFAAFFKLFARFTLFDATSVMRLFICAGVAALLFTPLRAFSTCFAVGILLRPRRGVVSVLFTRPSLVEESVFPERVFRFWDLVETIGCYNYYTEIIFKTSFTL